MRAPGEIANLVPDPTIVMLLCLYVLLMAIPNFVRSLGSGFHGQLVESYGYDVGFLVAAVSVGVGTILCLLARYGRMDTIRAPESATKLSDPAAMPGVPAGAATT